MATIEERAQAYRKETEISVFKSGMDISTMEFEYAYVKGANDQKQIDLNKACDEFLCFLNTRVDNPYYQLRKEDFPYWVNDFRKALEEEI